MKLYSIYRERFVVAGNTWVLDFSISHLPASVASYSETILESMNFNPYSFLLYFFREYIKTRMYKESSFKELHKDQFNDPWDFFGTVKK